MPREDLTGSGGFNWLVDSGGRPHLVFEADSARCGRASVGGEVAVILGCAGRCRPEAACSAP
jgi:hypothetical protein